MKYFIDTEFIEGPQKEPFPISLFRKETPPTIDLISIGIVSEDGREFYAISKDFNLKEAWNRFQREEETPFEKQNGWKGKKVYWLRENVLKPIWIDLFLNYESEFTFLKGIAYDQLEKELKEGKHHHFFTLKSLKALINRYGKTNKQIAKAINYFCHSEYHIMKKFGSINFGQNKYSIKPEFYAYYADYDWVVFCWLFGKMIDLPESFPKYCNDLKQILDEKQNILLQIYGNIDAVKIKEFDSYPKQENEHNAIEDARWNKKLYEFLNQI